MRKTADATVGLVLSGGGAKGAYQAGVWKAMVQFGVADCVKAISGTSVGAINAAAFALVRDPNQIRDFWVDHVEEVAKPNLSALTLPSLLKSLAKIVVGQPFPFSGLLDRSALESILHRLLPSEWPFGAPEVYTTSLECIGSAFSELSPASYERIRFRLSKEADHQRRLAKIVASCAIPWCFDPVEFDGRRFVDGGWNDMGGDNLPFRPILRCHPNIQTLIVVRCNSADVEPGNFIIRHRPDIEVIEIRPAKPLRGLFTDEIESIGIDGVHDEVVKWSGTLAFKSNLVKEMFNQGYADGLASLKLD